MVKGLDLFKKHFASFQQNYSLIGGVACMLAFEKAGLAFRATRDLDIVVFVEALDRRFATAFWDFIKQGNYESRQRSTGKKLFYRFHNPSHSSYPDIIELFSRASAKVFHREGSHLTPIPITEEISSLSAILLNDDYYQFIHDGKMAIDGISIINPAHIIPLKAKAYLDLSAQAKEVLMSMKKTFASIAMISSDCTNCFPPPHPYFCPNQSDRICKSFLIK